VPAAVATAVPKPNPDSTFGNLRVIVRDGEPWFVAKDVCDALGFTHTPSAIRELDADERDTVRIQHSTSGNPNVTIINESGLYSLILRSRKPEAKAFKKWVTGTVLPAIRKDGGYIMGEEKVAKGELSGGLCSRLWASVFLLTC
jgi:prophage antirepressor-like protein